MTMRRAPIMPLPAQDTPATQRLADTLGQGLGFLVPLLVLQLVQSEAGLSQAAAVTPGTALLSTSQTIDWNDTGVDSFRLVGYANDPNSTSAVLRYVVNGVTLASVGVPQAGAASFVGPWTRITQAQRALIAGDQVGTLMAVGNGVNALTLSSVSLQARTVSRIV